ncbi:MAG: hypothetical protein Q9196_006575, partial [Gyalolechia fulgens]
MSRAPGNPNPTGGSYGGHLATSLDLSKFGRSSTTVSSASFASGKTNKPTPAEKLRQQKIIEAWGGPSSQASPASSQLPRGQPRTQASSPTPLASSVSSSQVRAPKPSWPTAEQVQANAVSQDAKFPCPYTGCERGFGKLSDLLEHKLGEHDYCKICDEDFEDFDALHDHKIASDRHITCTVCSLDFKSEMGRDRHYSQMHGSAHNITCRACNETFAKGAALLLHFENNLCRPEEKPGISADKFESQRAGVAMVMQARNRKVDGQGEDGSFHTLPGVSPGGSFAPSTVGGVPIEPAEQPDFLMNDDFPPLPKASGGRPPSPAESNASIDSILSEHHYGTLNTGNLAVLNHTNHKEEKPPRASEAGWPVVGKDKDDLIEGMSNISMNAKLFPNAKGSPLPEVFAPPSIQPSRSGYSNLDFSSSIQLRPNAISGQWECPYFRCGHKCDLRQDLETHFNDPHNGHRGFDHVCPSCLKRFKTSSALMAHLESASTRCTIRDSKGYGNVLHLISGGHLNVDGRHNDGSTRIVSPEDAGK